MNQRFKSRTHLRRINSFHELELEKARLQLELIRVEDRINSNYKNLTDQLTFANIVKRIVDELTTTSAVVSNAIHVGKDIVGLFKKRKKKRKEQEEAEAGG